MKREDGFYWVKYDGEWEIARYYRKYDVWIIVGCEIDQTDLHFDEIDEQRITRNKPDL